MRLLGAVDSKAYGAKLGVSFPDQPGSIYFAYNKVPANPTAGISNGNLLSPYTQVYNTDPLYTTVMNYGLVSSRGSGHAWKLGANLKSLEEKLDLKLSYSRYDTAPYVANVNALMLDISYHLTGVLNGMTVRDRRGLEHGNPNWGSSFGTTASCCSTPSRRLEDCLGKHIEPRFWTQSAIPQHHCGKPPMSIGFPWASDVT